MPFTIQVTRNIKEGNTSIGGAARSFTVAQVNKMEETIADSLTDVEFLFSIDVSQLQVFHMESDVALTVETNSGSAAQETFTLVANVPVTFETGETAIFAGDITGLYVTNASGSTATLQVMSGVDV